jgi:hypothetical protein
MVLRALLLLLYMLDVVYIRKSIPLWYDSIPTTLHLGQCQNEALSLFSLMIYTIHDPLILADYSVYCCYRKVCQAFCCNKQVSHYRYIFFYLCRNSLQSPVKCSSTAYGIDTKPHASVSLLLY